VHGNAFGRGFNSGDLPDGINERLTVVRTGAAHKSAIDIEEN
jgi:hypothetical protein